MRIIIVAGGDLDEDQLKSVVAEDDYIIGADRGNAYLTACNLKPDIAIGDFDSMPIETLPDVPVIRLNPIKDETDTEYALLYALKKKPDEIIMMGVTGSRLDQTIASIEMLKTAFDEGVNAYIINTTNRIRVLRGDITLHKEKAFGKYISIIPFSEPLTDLTLKGFKYEVENFRLEKGISRGVSNEISDDSAFISCSRYFILMETSDLPQGRTLGD